MSRFRPRSKKNPVECMCQVKSHTWCTMLAHCASVRKFLMSISISPLQIRIKVLRKLRDSGSGGSSASREERGEFINAQLAKRSGWKHWWWLTLKWWSIMGAKLWKVTSLLL